MSSDKYQTSTGSASNKHRTGQEATKKRAKDKSEKRPEDSDEKEWEQKASGSRAGGFV
jgi:hypothetical protein